MRAGIIILVVLLSLVLLFAYCSLGKLKNPYTDDLLQFFSTPVRVVEKCQDGLVYSVVLENRRGERRVYDCGSLQYSLLKVGDRVEDIRPMAGEWHIPDGAK